MTTQLLRSYGFRLATLLFLLNFSVKTHAQIQWQTTLGGSNAEEYAVSCATNDGLIVANTSASGVSGNKTEINQGESDCWLTKLDAAGAVQWQKNIGGSGFDQPMSIKKTADGGYIVAIYSISGISGDKTEANRGNGTGDYWLVKTDAVGNIQWQKTIGGSADDYATVVEVLPNSGGYLVGGYSNSPISGEKTTASFGSYDFWVVRVDINGNPISDQTYGFNGDEILTSLQLTSDGGYIMGGYLYQSTNTGMPNYGIYDMLVIKADASGNVVWQKTYGGSGEDVLMHIRQNSDGNFIITGLTNSPISGVKTEPHCGGVYDVWALKISNTGAIIWQNTIGTNNWDVGYTSAETSDGGHLFFCNSEGGINGDKTLPNNGEADFWLIKTNSSGVIEWQKTVGGADHDLPLFGHLLADETIIVGGTSYSNVSGDKTTNSFGSNDTWVVKLGNSVPPSTPSVSNLNLCQNAPASPLTAGGQNLLWYTTQVGGVGSAVAPTPSTTALGTTTFYVTQTANGVESPRVALSVTVNPSPMASISGNAPRCSYATNPSTLSTPNNTGWQYVWSTGGTGSYITVTPSVSTTYSVTVSNQYGCTATSSFNLGVLNINPQITAPNSFCKNVSTTLTASGGTNYLWSTGHMAASITQALNQPRTYSVTVSQSGCSRVATKSVTIDQPFTAQIVGLNHSYPQNAAPVTLVGTPAGGSFTIANQPATVLNPPTLNIGTYIVRYNVSQGACTVIRNKVVYITTPVQNLIAPTNTHYFDAKPYLNAVKLDWFNTASKGGDYFVVQKMDKSGEFVDIQTVNATDDTQKLLTIQDKQATEGDNSYRLKTVLDNGSVQLSDIKTVKLSKSVNVPVYPNPASESVEIGLENYVGQSVNLSFYNGFGQLVLNKNIPNVQNSVEHLDISQLNMGIYQMRVTSPNKRETVVKVVVSQ